MRAPLEIPRPHLDERIFFFRAELVRQISRSFVSFPGLSQPADGPRLFYDYGGASPGTQVTIPVELLRSRTAMEMHI